MHAAVIVPEGSFLPPDLTLSEVEASFRQAAINERLTLRALARVDVVDPERPDYLGAITTCHSNLTIPATGA